MASRKLVLTQNAVAKNHRARWSNLTSGFETGEVLENPFLPNKTITVSGAFDSAWLIVEGSMTGNDGDYYPISSVDGKQILFTENGHDVFRGSFIYVRPRLIRATQRANVDISMLCQA